jgi:hypothetical protein
MAKTQIQPTKAELVHELNEAVILVNKVKTELLHYYASMSPNPLYKVNCSTDHDLLNKALNKIQHVSENLPSTTL